MRIAVFADIHANYHAFKACFEEAKRRGAEGFIFLGDFFTDMAYPQRTMDLIYAIQGEYPCHIVRGNREAYILAHHSGRENFRPGSNTGSLHYTYTNLRERDIEFVRRLPFAKRITIEGKRLAIAHSTFESDRFYFDPSRATLADAFEKMSGSLLLTGHSHVQYAAQREGKTILNPGSVGYATSIRARAQFAMIDVAQGKAEWEFFTIPYDLRSAIEDQFESGLTEHAHIWALSVVNTLIMGRNMTMDILKRVEVMRDAGASMEDEEIWLAAGRAAGLILEKEALLRLCEEGMQDD